MYWKKLQEQNDVLLKNIKTNLQKLEELLEKISKYDDDCIYRFYHYSFKVYSLQETTIEIVTLKSLAPQDITFNEFFETIFKEGTDKYWTQEHNKEWMKHTRPILEAFFHAKFFLTMAIKYGKELESAPMPLPSGWAALLYFYNLR